jgi:hypothetical protein
VPAGPSAVGTYGVQAWKPTNGIGVEKPGLHTCGRAGGPGSGGRAGSAGRLPSGRLGGAGSPIGGNPTDGSAAPVAAPAPTEGATVSAFIPIPGKPTPGRAMFATGSSTWASAKSDGEGRGPNAASQASFNGASAFSFAFAAHWAELASH